MPIVFVHGVGNREGPKYDAKQLGRDAFLRSYLAPALGLDVIELEILNPYWGGDGVTFRWQQSSLPEASTSLEPLGFDEALTTAQVDLIQRADTDLVKSASRSLFDVVDLLWSEAMSDLDSASDAGELAALSHVAFDYAAENQNPAWLAEASDGNFVDLLLHDLETMASSTQPNGEREWEHLGGSDLSATLRESASRLTSAIGNTTGSVVSRLARRRLHTGVSLFLGDVFEYLTRRGDRATPGPIPSTVLEAILRAESARTDSDPLIIIGHSLGGIIAYDVLTYFEPALEIDYLITVGSQVGLFEEMSMCSGSSLDPPRDPATDRLPLPENVKRWSNVFDLTDPLGFRVEGVFAGVKDLSYDTGYGIGGAHSGYFARASFYRRLAAHVGQAIQ